MGPTTPTMPNVPHNLAVGDECWLIVGGDDADRANVHPCKVTEIKGEGAKKEYTVNRPARTDEKNDLENPPNFDDIDVSGLSQQASRTAILTVCWVLYASSSHTCVGIFHTLQSLKGSYFRSTTSVIQCVSTLMRTRSIHRSLPGIMKEMSSMRRSRRILARPNDSR